MDRMMRTDDRTLSGFSLWLISCLFPGLPERNPRLQLANAFSVKPMVHEVSAVE
jgi:hypothetical protein